jgi:glycine/D-amino acid oxidase-like deaminating enzyme
METGLPDEQHQLPPAARFVVVGAGIHGLSTAWHLARRLRASGTGSGADVVVVDKAGVGAGASGIACGVVRNNYFQPAMRRLMTHSVDVWESDLEAFAYHPVGYLQISHEAMREDVARIHAEQQEIGYPSTFVDGARDSTRYLRGLFADWRAGGITSVLHEKRGGYAHNRASLEGLARKARAEGVRIMTGPRVTGFVIAGGAVAAVETDHGRVRCDQVVVAVGPWVRDVWAMLDLPATVTVRAAEGGDHDDVAMWRYWLLQEGTLDVDPDMLTDNHGQLPPVVHVDTDVPLLDEDGRVVTDQPWGIYYKPDAAVAGVQGGTMPIPVGGDAGDVAVDPYGPASPHFVVGDDFARMWTAALAHCHGRFAGMADRFRRERSGGIGCFTPDSFPLFDMFHQNAYLIADSNHGYKMLGVGDLVAAELLGSPQDLLEPFRFARYARGELHPTSRSPFPWS